VSPRREVGRFASFVNPSSISSRFGEVSLRPYQVQAIDNLQAHTRQGTRRVLITAPTGAGKSTIAGGVILSAFAEGQRALFIAHRRELILQMYRRLLDMGLPAQDVGILMASDPRRKPQARVQVASIDTLRQRQLPPADLVFVDECHRAMAATYRRIAAAYPQAVHVGLTATPYRADGQGLRDAYDVIVPVATPRQLIAEGYLVEPRVFTVPPASLPDLSGVRVRGGDYDEQALEEAVNRASLVGSLVQHWMAHAQGIRTVVFAVSIAHSRHIVDCFLKAGIPSEHLDGGTPTAERDAILGRLERGETMVVGSVMTLCEGWDQPSVKCAILARPTKSTGLYLQQAGRILRPWNGLRAILLDHAGCVLEHGLPQDERPFSLDGAGKIDKKDLPKKPRVCPSCQAVVPLRVLCCPECKKPMPVVLEMPEETAGELVEAAPEHPHRAVWDELCATAAAKNYRRGWVYHAYKARFGCKPPKQFVVPPLPSDQDAALFDLLRSSARSGGHVSWAEIDKVYGRKSP